MKIKSLTFKDKDRNILIDNVEFADLTLFVGASGVGKTQILDAIKVLQAICRNNFKGSAQWDITLQHEKSEIQWKGDTIVCLDEVRQFLPAKGEDGMEVQYTTEEILKDGLSIAKRNGDAVDFESSSIPKLSTNSSLVNLIQEIHLVEMKIFFNKIIEEMYGLNFIFPNDIDEINVPFAEKLFLSISIPISFKLCIAYKRFKNIFRAIENDFIAIFPFVEKVSIGKFQHPILGKDNQTIIIHEKEVEKKIIFSQLSSGMQKSFMLLAAIHLAPSGSVLIIDELENCLGVNCLDSIVEILQDNDRDIQAIFTSHHPYIINAIPREHWRLVSREGGVIHSDAVADKMSTISKHDAFLQLLQMPAFRDGVRS